MEEYAIMKRAFSDATNTHSAKDKTMIFGKHINRYYIKHGPMLLLGLLALLMIDYLQLQIPKFYRMVINGINTGSADLGGVSVPFDMTVLLDRICLPMIVIILAMAFGRFLWRICFFGSAIKMEADLRNRMFDRAKDLSRQYYQVNKVGGMMSLFTNDLETVQECFGSGILMLFDALLLGGMAFIEMWKMDPLLTGLSMIPMLLLLAVSALIGRYMMKKWDIRQEAYSRISDFSQESFSGIAVIKSFVKEGKELWAFKKLNRENEVANVEFTRSSVLLHILVTLFVESVTCVILGYGGYLVWRGAFNAGELMEFIGYFSSIVWPIMAVSELIDMTSRGKASLKRIGELIDAEIMADENSWLYRYLSMKEEHGDYSLCAASVISSSSASGEGGDYALELTLNRGTSSGVETGMPVVTSLGLVGVVVETGLNHCRVMTILDTSVSVGAVTTRATENGLCEGDYTVLHNGCATLKGLPEEADVAVDDIVVTSGRGSVYPYGIPIGRVTEVTANAFVRTTEAAVEPFTDFSDLTQVVIMIDYIHYVDGYEHTQGAAP